MLSSRANISLTESNMLPIFEREAYINLIIKDINRKKEQLLEK